MSNETTKETPHAILRAAIEQLYEQFGIRLTEIHLVWYDYSTLSEKHFALGVINIEGSLQ